MTIFNVRQIMSMDGASLAELLPEHQLQFDDGVIINSTRNETIWSNMFWSLFAPYPKARILPKHHVTAVLKGKPLNASTHLKVCSRILRSIVEDEDLRLPIEKEPLLKAIYQAISDAMGKLSTLTARSVTSIDILDFVQIAKHPEIQSIRDNCISGKITIEYAYDQTDKFIMSSQEFDDNGLAKAYRSGMVKKNQVMQCVMVRGIPSEVDGSVFPRPIWSCYTLGNQRFYDFVADSRTAAKSHYYADTALKDSEYMARKFQLFTASVESIVYEDCGSTKLMDWVVQGKRKDSSGATTYGGDLEMLIGKYYLEDGDEEYKIIEGDEEHLIGKHIRFRSSLYCKTKNHRHICHICAGRLSENISRFANVGHLGTISTTKDLTQSILSIKHVNTSSTLVKILLAEFERKFLNTGKDGVAIHVNEALKLVDAKLVIPKDEASGLTDIRAMKTVEFISLSRISEVSSAKLIMSQKGRPMDAPINVTQRGRPSMLSREFITYAKSHGWTVDEQSNFVFDLKDWDYTLPVFVMPNKEESYVDLAAAVETMVRANLKMIESRMIDNAPAILLQELFDLVNSKFHTNILSFEIIIYSLMVEAADDYAMGRNSENPKLGVADLLTSHRSLGNAMTYEGMSDVITDPFSFYKGKRPDSPMDVYLAPREVVAEYQDWRRVR